MVTAASNMRSCPRCGGHWVTLEAAGRKLRDPYLAELVGESVDSFAIAGTRRCPACFVPMREIAFRGIEVDVCGTCEALFLDPGEVRRLAEASGHRPAAVSRSDGSLLADRPAPYPGESRFLQAFGEFLFDLSIWL